MIKHRLLASQGELLRHLPDTYWLTASRAIRMLNSYSSIYLKPDKGSGGTGIIKISRTSSGYEILRGRTRRRVDKTGLLQALRKYAKSSKQYLVQQGLHLARYNGRKFDVRVYLQKPYEEWKVSGMAARVASARGQYVTNKHQGGYGKPLKKVLRVLFAGKSRKVSGCVYTLKRTSLRVARTLDRRFTDIRELGIDFGIERSGRIWFIEANSRPMHQLFKQLPDKTMLWRIRRNKRLIYAT